MKFESRYENAYTKCEKFGVLEIELNVTRETMKTMSEKVHISWLFCVPCLAVLLILGFSDGEE